MHERVLRGVGKTALGGAVATPPLWFLSPILALAIVALAVSAVALVVFGLWYALWALDGSGSGAKSSWYRAEYLGAGGIWMCQPYWVYGPRFRRRIQLRRLRQLEHACGLGPSAFTAELSELR